MGNQVCGARILRRPMINILHDFIPGEKIDDTAYGEVREVTEIKSGEIFACKTSYKKKLKGDPEKCNDVRQEVEILEHLSQMPDIVKFKAAYEDRDAVHLVMELCKGGNLWDRILNEGPFTEKRAAAVFSTIIKSIHQCSFMGVMQRDINPINFVFLDKDMDSSIKLIDFEYAVFFEPGENFTRLDSDPWKNFLSPEVFDGCYGVESETWSAGMLLYTMLNGGQPFDNLVSGQIEKAVKSRNLTYPPDPWDSFSDEAKQLIDKITALDPSKRPLLSEILDDPWMVDNGVGLDYTIRNLVVPQSERRKMPKERNRKIIGWSLSKKEIAELKQILESIDNDMDGRISIAEMLAERNKLEGMGIKISESDIRLLMIESGADKDEKVNFAKFLESIVPKDRFVKEELLFEAFEELDKDLNGSLPPEKVKRILMKHEMGDEQSINKAIATFVTDTKVSSAIFEAIIRFLFND